MKKRRLQRKVRIGEPVVVTMTAPATSGYQWRFIPDGTAWRLVGERKRVAETFGGATETEYRFEPLHRGRIEIHGRLQRPWEDEPIETVAIAVTVE